MIDFPSSTPWILFGVSACAISAIVILAAFAALSGKFKFFPPPTKEGWQHRTFMTLFRLFLYPLAALSFLFFEPVPPASSLPQYSIGTLLLVIGFSLAFWVTFQMGWRNAFGEKHGLKTQGWFSVSRNPVYVATWVGMIGWGLLANTPLVWILLVFWATLYLLAPIFEEPWLEQQYGEEYLDYKRGTRRFF
ncbi:isoprenylcysteine carboxylmethyltransferase family protein [Erythrobacter sp. F6033]|uniref:methyltransferase family protein n=1 Tax=Erythrobacter sp. F6033 TaxID=2926401 RepID=UPI001FF3833B|nr:isoprenylcysteine carboxylmethyltransferase family protein [Erythrobacter sp. F6033]MCK0127522.1 isoprenylcysteine carboxylmethyltransferase family protein [Erythrobacter sp. F6033]